MKIGIIALGFHPGQTGGTESYFRNLLEGLIQYDKKNSYTLVVHERYKKEAAQLLVHSDWGLVCVREQPPFATRLLRKLRVIDLTNEQILASKISSMSFDVVHFPFQVVYPKGIEAKKVLTFHDMQEVHYPDFFTKDELEVRKLTFGPSVQEADKVITISNFTKNDIKENFGLNQYKKCTTIYHGYTPNEAKVHSLNIPSEIKGKKYFYYPAATWPHKNHERLLRAFSLLGKEKKDYYLVLTGMSRQKAKQLDVLSNSLGITNKVINLGYVDYELLPYIYKNAFALVYPSLFEGFGLPLLEAMHAKVPVCCSNISSIPEVGGKAVLYFDPSSERDIYIAMLKLIQDQPLRKDLVKKGLVQLEKFTDELMVKKTIGVYMEVFNG